MEHRTGLINFQQNILVLVKALRLMVGVYILLKIEMFPKGTDDNSRTTKNGFIMGS